MNEQMRLLSLQLAVQATATAKDPDVMATANSFYEFLKGDEPKQDLGAIITDFVKKQQAAEQTVAA